MFTFPSPSPGWGGFAPVMCASYQAITDEDGYYEVTDIPLSVNAVEATVTARKAGYVTEYQTLTLWNGLPAQADFVLVQAYVNENSNTVDGVVFTVATERAAYQPGEYLRVKYSVENNSVGSVTYDFSSGCQFDMTLTAPNQEVLYWYMEVRACTMASTQITLAPGEKREFLFIPYLVPGEHATLTIAAQMIGYPGSAVSVDITVDLATARVQAPHTTSFSGELGYSPSSRQIRFGLDIPQRVSVEAFRADGTRLSLLETTSLGSGLHRVDPGSSVPRGSVLVIRLRTERGVLSKKLVVTR